MQIINSRVTQGIDVKFLQITNKPSAIYDLNHIAYNNVLNGMEYSEKIVKIWHLDTILVQFKGGYSYKNKKYHLKIKKIIFHGEWLIQTELDQIITLTGTVIKEDVADFDESTKDIYYICRNKLFQNSKLIFTTEQDLIRLLVSDESFILLDCTNTVFIVNRNQIQTAFFIQDPVVDWIISNKFIVILQAEQVKIYTMDGNLFSQAAIPKFENYCARKNGFFTIFAKTVCEIQFKWDFAVVDQMNDDIDELCVYNNEIERLFIKTKDGCITCKCPKTQNTLFVVIPPTRYNGLILECNKTALFLLCNEKVLYYNCNKNPCILEKIISFQDHCTCISNVTNSIIYIGTTTGKIYEFNITLNQISLLYSFATKIQSLYFCNVVHCVVSGEFYSDFKKINTEPCIKVDFGYEDKVVLQLENEVVVYSLVDNLIRMTVQGTTLFVNKQGLFVKNQHELVLVSFDEATKHSLDILIQVDKVGVSSDGILIAKGSEILLYQLPFFKSFPVEIALPFDITILPPNPEIKAKRLSIDDFKQFEPTLRRSSLGTRVLDQIIKSKAANNINIVKKLEILQSDGSETDSVDYYIPEIEIEDITDEHEAILTSGIENVGDLSSTDHSVSHDNLYAFVIPDRYQAYSRRSSLKLPVASMESVNTSEITSTTDLSSNQNLMAVEDESTILLIENSKISSVEVLNATDSRAKSIKTKRKFVKSTSNLSKPKPSSAIKPKIHSKKKIDAFTTAVERINVVKELTKSELEMQEMDRILINGTFNIEILNYLIRMLENNDEKVKHQAALVLASFNIFTKRNLEIYFPSVAQYRSILYVKHDAFLKSQEAKEMIRKANISSWFKK